MSQYCLDAVAFPIDGRVVMQWRKSSEVVSTKSAEVTNRGLISQLVRLLATVSEPRVPLARLTLSAGIVPFVLSGLSYGSVQPR